LYNNKKSIIYYALAQEFPVVGFPAENILTELPQILTGAFTGTIIVFPDSTPGD
jgi:hypothetical protein